MDFTNTQPLKSTKNVASQQSSVAQLFQDEFVLIQAEEKKKVIDNIKKLKESIQNFYKPLESKVNALKEMQDLDEQLNQDATMQNFLPSIRSKNVSTMQMNMTGAESIAKSNNKISDPFYNKILYQELESLKTNVNKAILKPNQPFPYHNKQR